jgi:hypothetical protein
VSWYLLEFSRIGSPFVSVSQRLLASSKTNRKGGVLLRGWASGIEAQNDESFSANASGCVFLR